MKDKLTEMDKSQRVSRSGKHVEISLVEGSFRRIAGIREEADFSGAFILRTVEIHRETGQSLGFYIREGDGWLRKDGIFISRVNLGSTVEVNGLLHVGDEVIKVNDVAVSGLSLNDVVLIMTVMKKLVLTIKVLTSVSLTRTLSTRIPRRKASSSSKVVPVRPKSMSYAERIASKESENGLLGGESVKVENPYEEVNLRPLNRQQIAANLNMTQPLSSMTGYVSNRGKQVEEIEMSISQPEVRREPTPNPPLAASTPVLPHKLQNSVEVEVHIDAEPTTNPYEEVAFDDKPPSMPPDLILPTGEHKDGPTDPDSAPDHDDSDDEHPPPIPPSPLPEDSSEDDERFQDGEGVSNDDDDDSEGEEEKSELQVSEEPDKSEDDHTCSGLLVVTVHSLSINSDSEETENNPSIDRVEFLMLVDSILKIKALLDPANQGDVESRVFAVDILENQQISITLKSDHFSKSRQITLFTPATEDSVRKVLLPFRLDRFGRAKIYVEYQPMSIATPRMNPAGDHHNHATFKEFVDSNPNNSHLPLVVERCVRIVEKYGLQESNLYNLCCSEAAKDEAFSASISQTKSEKDIKDIITRNSVHAFTGVLKDFFRKLPEPFFTNKLCTSLTEVASMDNAQQVGDFLQNFIDCLPEEAIPTLELLLNHFKNVCSYSSENGMTVDKLTRVFGPLLLTPALALDLNTSATTETYADDYQSQARVITILMNSEPDMFPTIYKV